VKEKFIDEALLVKYLLGELSEEAEARIEEQYFVDDRFHEELQAVELELIDLYIDNELSKEAQEKFEKRFLSVPERLRDVNLTRALKDYALKTAVAETHKKSEAKHTIRFWFKPFFTPLRIATATLILLALALLGWRIFISRSVESQVIIALNEAYHEQRLSLARISRLAYAPLVELRGTNQESVDQLALNRAERLALDAVHERPDTGSYHALGRVYLAKRDFDMAMAQLQKALESNPTNAQIHNDLGVALFEKARIHTKLDERVIDLAQSRVHLDRAIELDKSDSESIFNRALWYEFMSLPQEASREWQKFAEADHASPWATEARQRLQVMQEKQAGFSQTREQILQTFIAAYNDRDDQRAWQAFSRSWTRTGNTITEKLLNDYLESLAMGRSDEARRTVQILSYAGALADRRGGDRFSKEIAQFYALITPAQQKLISRARELMRSANESCKQTEYEQAANYFAEAKELFTRAGDACEAAFAELWVGNCNLRINPDNSIPIFSRLRQEFERSGYKWLLAQALYGLSDAQSSKRDFTKTLEYADSSSRLLNEVGDLSGVLRNMQFPVAMQQQYGKYAKSTNLILRAFDLAATFAPEPQDVWIFYQQMATNFNTLDYPTLALSYEQVALNIAQDLAIPLYVSRSHASLGLIYQKLKDYDQAIHNAQLALIAGESVRGERSRNNLIANSALNLAHIYRESGDFSKALESYNRAIELHARLNQDIYILQAHRGKLLSLIALNDDSAANEEVKRAVALIEEYRPKIREESNRNSFFDLAQSVYDIASDFTFSRMNDTKAAFDYSELSHARSLLDLLVARSKPIEGTNTPDLKLHAVAQPLELAEIMQRLPEQAQLLQYAVLDDKLLVWLISKDSFQSRWKEITATQINMKVERFLGLLAKRPQSNLDEVIHRAKDLYEDLLGPVEPLLDKQKQLYIIPDKALSSLPFGALVSPSSNRFVVEDYALASTLSASVFIKCSAAAAKKASVKNETMLSIGNPRFSQDEFPSLEDLPSAANEAKEVAGLYSKPVRLLTEEATPARVRGEMAKAAVIHYAGHYVINPEAPMLSRLALARSPSEAHRAPRPNGYITASEIYNMKLPQTRLVVLSACQTGIERSYKGEGAISMARPFIQAGVPLVIASLWPVETTSSAELMIRFHGYRKAQGLSTIEALRRAQVDMLHNEAANYNHPYYWASFAVIGGFANF
jgi:CHAT domain-containing protein/Tfp pilus assembly protein PilF